MSAANVIVVTDLKRHFAGNAPLFSRKAPPVVRAVDGVSFNVPKGSCFAIVGESGSGKSSIARLLVGLLRASSGTVSIDGQPLSELDEEELRRLRRKIQLVLQDPRASLDPRMTIFDTLHEALVVHDLHPSRQSRIERILSTIAFVGLNRAHLDRYPSELSGGQRQRAAIARAIICEPEILVLDEPVSALDVSVQAQIINLLMELKAKFALTFVIITHDLALVEHMADAVGVMYLGRFVEQGPIAEVCDAPMHPYTQSLMAASSHLPESDASGPRHRPLEGSIPSPLAVPSGCAFHTRCPLARSLAQGGATDTVDTPDGRVPARCVREAPQPVALHGRTSTAACHFQDESTEARATLQLA